MKSRKKMAQEQKGLTQKENDEKRANTNAKTKHTKLERHTTNETTTRHHLSKERAMAGATYA